MNFEEYLKDATGVDEIRLIEFDLIIKAANEYAILQADKARERERKSIRHDVQAYLKTL